VGLEFWTSGAGIPVSNARQAQRAEEAGFDGLVFVDSQNLAGDCYVALALAAHATRRLRLGTGVTNPFTRHPAVTACAIATVQAESGGRAHLGIGRGDSALAHLGRAPEPVAVLERYLERLQGYLRGEALAFEPGANLDALPLASRPEASRLEWLRPDQPKVPVDVVATGPRVLGVAARHAERVSLAVGADPARLRWAMDVAREARVRAGLGEAIPFGAYLPVVVHDDPAVARRLGGGGLALFARFSVMHGRVLGPASEVERSGFERIAHAYDMTRHARPGSPQAEALGDDFAREFGIVGPAAHCIERLCALADLGIDRFVVVGPTPGAGPPELQAAAERFAAEVMPAVRRHVG
jgi:5,10-methylenetetrahydromethanopterin reductase